MNDKNIATPRQAGARIARLYINGTPTPEKELEARRDLALANLYKAARDMLNESQGLDPQGAAHVVGYILGQSGVKYDATTVIEGIVRNAVSDAQSEG
jgi:hypothetical protein